MLSRTKPLTPKWIFLLSVCLALLSLGYAFGERAGLFIGLFLSFLFLGIAQRGGVSPLETFLKPRWLKGEDSWKLNVRCIDLAQFTKSVPMIVGVSPHKTAFACLIIEPFADRKLVFSAGLLDRLQPEELDALLVEMHFFCKRTLGVFYNTVQVICQNLLFVAQTLDSWTRLPLFSVATGVLVLLLQRLSSPKRSFFEVDAESASALPHRVALAQALWKIDYSCRLNPLNVPIGTSCFFITSPGGRNHPSIKLRIEKLVGTFPI